MREQIEGRLKGLRAEFEDGQRMLDDLEARQASLRGTLLRISGAMQVLEELLSSGEVAAVPESVPESVPEPLHAA